MQDKKAIKYLLICVSILCVDSCKMLNIITFQEQLELYQGLRDNYIESLSTSDGFYVDVVVPISPNKIIIPNSTIMLNLYDKFYRFQYKDETTFFKALYSGKVKSINKHFRYVKSINLNPDIMDKYRKKGIEWLINEYFSKLTNKSLTFKKDIDYTVVFIMFTNNYYLYFNDYVPNYTFKLELDSFVIPNMIQ